MANFFDAFPDAAYTLNDSFFAGDKGMWRGTWHATQRKEWESIPATGRRAKWTVIIILAGLIEGKLAEDWVEYDRYNLFRQAGALKLTTFANVRFRSHSLWSDKSARCHKQTSG